MINWSTQFSGPFHIIFRIFEFECGSIPLANKSNRFQDIFCCPVLFITLFTINYKACISAFWLHKHNDIISLHILVKEEFEVGIDLRKYFSEWKFLVPTLQVIKNAINIRLCFLHGCKTRTHYFTIPCRSLVGDIDYITIMIYAGIMMWLANVVPSIQITNCAINPNHNLCVQLYSQIVFTNCIYKLYLQIVCTFTNCIHKLYLQIVFTNCKEYCVSWVWYASIKRNVKKHIPSSTSLLTIADFLVSMMLNGLLRVCQMIVASGMCNFVFNLVKFVSYSLYSVWMRWWCVLCFFHFLVSFTIEWGKKEERRDFTKLCR